MLPLFYCRQRLFPTPEFREEISHYSAAAVEAQVKGVEAPVAISGCRPRRSQCNLTSSEVTRAVHRTLRVARNHRGLHGHPFALPLEQCIVRFRLPSHGQASARIVKSSDCGWLPTCQLMAWRRHDARAAAFLPAAIARLAISPSLANITPLALKASVAPSE